MLGTDWCLQFGSYDQFTSSATSENPWQQVFTLPGVDVDVVNELKKRPVAVLGLLVEPGLYVVILEPFT